MEDRLHLQLHRYLGGRVPIPALRLITVPTFYSVAVSLYVETAEPVTTEAATAALAGERIKIRKSDLDPPTPVEVTGSSDILVDRISLDAAHPKGLWLWAVADNLHLTATNAVELAASLENRRAPDRLIHRLRRLHRWQRLKKHENRKSEIRNSNTFLPYSDKNRSSFQTHPPQAPLRISIFEFRLSTAAALCLLLSAFCLLFLPLLRLPRGGPGHADSPGRQDHRRAGV